MKVFSLLFLFLIKSSFQFICNEDIDAKTLKECSPNENRNKNDSYCCLLKIASLRDSTSSNFCLTKSNTLNHYFRKDDHFVSIICDYHGSQITHDPIELNIQKYLEIALKRNEKSSIKILEEEKQIVNEENNSKRSLQNSNTTNNNSTDTNSTETSKEVDISYYYNKYRQVDFYYPKNKQNKESVYPVYKTLKLPTSSTPIIEENDDEIIKSIESRICDKGNVDCDPPCCKLIKK